MEIETLKRSHLKRNIIIGVIVVLIISAIILNFTRAKYRTSYSVPLINGTINYSAADLNIVAITVNGEEVDTIPTGNYELSEESYCEVNGNRDDSVKLSYDMDSQMLTVTPMTTKGTKCYLYFDKKTTAMNTILANKEIRTRSDFSVTVEETTTGVIYESLDETQYDNDGKVYYFAGNPTDNWVQFGEFYWRIIRINGDGSIRLIYNGTSTSQNAANTLDTKSRFNDSQNLNEYVGYKYTLGEQYGITTDSTIKKVVDKWYENNLRNYSEFISVEAGFCGDRDTANNATWGSTTYLDYKSAERLTLNNIKPVFKCNNTQDYYTLNNSVNGNKSLTYPIGLITADEVAFAGGVWNINNMNYYLYSINPYFTMSPLSKFNMLFVNSNGDLNWDVIDGIRDVRPVINLRSDITLSGSGTSTDPYTVV